MKKFCCSPALTADGTKGLWQGWVEACATKGEAAHFGLQCWLAAVVKWSCWLRWAPSKTRLHAAKLVLCKNKAPNHLPAALVWKQIAVKRKAPKPDEEEDETDVIWTGTSSARSTGPGTAAQAGAAQVGPTDQAGGPALAAAAAAPGDSSQVRLVGGLTERLEALGLSKHSYALDARAFGVVVPAPGQSKDGTPLALAHYESCPCIMGEHTFCLHSLLAASVFGCLCVPLHWACTLDCLAAPVRAMRCSQLVPKHALMKAAPSSLGQ